MQTQRDALQRMVVLAVAFATAVAQPVGGNGENDGNCFTANCDNVACVEWSAWCFQGNVIQSTTDDPNYNRSAAIVLSKIGGGTSVEHPTRMMRQRTRESCGTQPDGCGTCTHDLKTICNSIGGESGDWSDWAPAQNCMCSSQGGG